MAVALRVDHQSNQLGQVLRKGRYAMGRGLVVVGVLLFGCGAVAIWRLRASEEQARARTDAAISQLADQLVNLRRSIDAPNGGAVDRAAFPNPPPAVMHPDPAPEMAPARPDRPADDQRS